MTDPTDDDIHNHFKLHHGGPNPYYACIHCGEVEPGLREWLSNHIKKCEYHPHDHDTTIR